MSREVRRVPLNWLHPTVPNPYWVEQQWSRRRRRAPESRLHAPEVRFIGLLDDYPGALQRWEQGREDWAARRGSDWEWRVRYHLTGYTGYDGTWRLPIPVTIYGADGNTVVWFGYPEDEGDLAARLSYEYEAGSRPNPAHYMPAWDAPAESLGWCLYETVSEGTPVTPVYETAEELIEHLVNDGEDWYQEPYRRSAAEALVRSGSSFGSFVAIGGRVFDGARDIDLLQDGAS